MNDLSPKARALIEEAQSADGPNEEDRKRVRNRLIAQLGVGALAGSAVSGAGAAGAAAIGSAGGTAASVSGAPPALGTGAAAAGAAMTEAAVAGSAGAGAATAGAAATAAGTAGAGIAGGAGAGAAVTATGASMGLAAKVTIATVVVGAVGVGTATVPWEKISKPASEAGATEQTAPATPAATPAPVRKPQSNETPAITGEKALEEPVEEEIVIVDEKPALPGANGKRKNGRANTAAKRSQLDAELELLRMAQESLRQGDASQALVALKTHARMFPGGMLRQEREAARAISFCKLGRTKEGRAAARRLTAESPRSPLMQRVNRSCGIPGE